MGQSNLIIEDLLWAIANRRGSHWQFKPQRREKKVANGVKDQSSG